MHRGHSPLLLAWLAALLSAACNESALEPSTPNDEGSGGRGPSAAGGSGTGGSPGNTAGSANGAGAGGTVDSAGSGGSSGGSSPSGGSGGDGAGGAPPLDCSSVDDLAIEPLTTKSIAEMGTPFDPNVEDVISPFNWNTNYGRPPELIALADGEHVDVLWRDSKQKAAFVVRAEKEANGYAIARAYKVPILDKLMGFARDEAGNYYYATGVDEDDAIDETTPAPGLHRSGIVRLIKFAPEGGCALLNVDVDLAREEKDPDSEPIVNPMVAASSRLAYGDGALALVHGINTAPDNQGIRHQKAITTHFDATTGAATRTSSMWVSHSFDQRLLYDGAGFVEVHLGDAYPRSIALGRFQATQGTRTYELFLPKGGIGENSTFSRLGGIAPIENGDNGYLVVFTTDRSLDLPTGDWQTLVGTRDLAFLRVKRNFAELSPQNREFVVGSDTLTVTRVERVNNQDVEVDYVNRFNWLTDYASASAQADRPRVAAVGGDKFIVLWERWDGKDDESATFAGTHGLLLRADGMVEVAAKKVSDRHLSRGDDVIAVGDRALFVTGNAAQKKLVLNFVAQDLSVEAVELP